jgi:hypothetical protein
MVMQTVYLSAEICGYWRGDLDVRTGEGMRKPEGPRMEHRPVARFRTGMLPTVDPVADERVTDARQMNANLVLPPGLECDAQQRCPGAEALEHLDMGTGAEGFLKILLIDGDAPPVAIVAADGTVDGEPVLGGGAVHEREIGAIEGVVAEQVSTRGMHGRIKRNRQRSRGAAVEAVQHPDVGLTSALVPGVLAGAAEQRVFVLGSSRGRRNRQQTRGLVDDHERAIFIEQVEPTAVSRCARATHCGVTSS